MCPGRSDVSLVAHSADGRTMVEGDFIRQGASDCGALKNIPLCVLAACVLRQRIYTAAAMKLLSDQSVEPPCRVANTVAVAIPLRGAEHRAGRHVLIVFGVMRSPTLLLETPEITNYRSGTESEARMGSRPRVHPKYSIYGLAVFMVRRNPLLCPL